LTQSSPDSKTIAIGFDYKLQIWNISSGELLETIEIKPKGVHSLCFSPDSKMLLMGAADKKIRIWKIA
jgi:WD40 repeat protein